MAGLKKNMYFVFAVAVMFSVVGFGEHCGQCKASVKTKKDEKTPENSVNDYPMELQDDPPKSVWEGYLPGNNTQLDECFVDAFLRFFHFIVQKTSTLWGTTIRENDWREINENDWIKSFESRIQDQFRVQALGFRVQGLEFIPEFDFEGYKKYLRFRISEFVSHKLFDSENWREGRINWGSICPTNTTSVVTIELPGPIYPLSREQQNSFQRISRQLRNKEQGGLGIAFAVQPIMDRIEREFKITTQFPFQRRAENGHRVYDTTQVQKSLEEGGFVIIPQHPNLSLVLQGESEKQYTRNYINIGREHVDNVYQEQRARYIQNRLEAEKTRKAEKLLRNKLKFHLNDGYGGKQKNVIDKGMGQNCPDQHSYMSELASMLMDKVNLQKKNEQMKVEE